MLAYSDEAGPSRLSIPAAVAPHRPKRNPRRAARLLSDESETDDEESSRVGSSECSIDATSEHTSLFGTDAVAAAVEHRCVPLSLLTMASEMVRPPEVD